MFKKVRSFLSIPKRLVAVNLILILTLIFGNYYWQTLCKPTNWATLTLFVCFISSIFYPLFYNSQNKIIRILFYFFNGVSFSIFLYFILFLEHMNFYGMVLILIGIGLITFIPHILAFQLLWNSLIKKSSIGYRKYFYLGFIASLIVVFYSGISYKNTLSQIKESQKDNYRTIEKSFMTEKILGMHFIYHTRFCEYDGWRPPKHEPLLVLGLWLNNRKDPIDLNLEDRINLYKEIYPENKIKFDCSCAYSYQDNYYNDQLLTK